MVLEVLLAGAVCPAIKARELLRAASHHLPRHFTPDTTDSGLTLFTSNDSVKTHFHSILLATLSALAILLALGPSTTTEFSTILNERPAVPTPAPVRARFRQATRASILARRARVPAKRQASNTPICSRASTGTTPYAVFTDAYFDTAALLRDHYPASLEQCYADCEADLSKSHFSSM